MTTILYCGDTELNGAAGYLAGLMSHTGWGFEYVPSHVPLTTAHLDHPRSLFIFSDYPAAQLSPACQPRVLATVHAGAGLLMIGGWESFKGHGGDWETSALAEALPVTIGTTDDRRNFDQPTLLRCLGDVAEKHPILTGLPWGTRPPLIGGLNRVSVKSGATPLLGAFSYRCSFPESPAWSQAVTKFAEDWLLPPKIKTALAEAAVLPHPLSAPPVLTLAETFPALVVGTYGQGRTAAFLSDVAPHWVGGLVDWGPDRVTAQAVGGPAVEVGSDYARFWTQLLAWTMATT